MFGSQEIGITILYTLCAIIGGAGWLFYFRHLDIFKTEKWWHLIVVFVLGCCTPQIALALYDGLPWQHDPSNLVYWTAHVGFIEETAKILPLVLVWIFFQKAFEEPVDFLIYGSVSALGFATMENAMYFQHHGSDLIQPRLLFSLFGHMIDTSIVAYSIALLKFRYKGHYYLPVLGFGAACLAHGMYDYILSTNLEGRLLIFFGLYLVLIECWAVMINNCLNNSPHFNNRLTFHPSQFARKVWIIFLTGTALQLLAALVQLDESKARGTFTYLMLAACFYFIITYRLTSFSLVPGKWNVWIPRLPFKISFGGGSYLRIRGNSINETELTSLLDKKVILAPAFKDRDVTQGPLEGELIDKIYLKDDQVFYVFEAARKLPKQGFSHTTFLIRAPFDSETNHSKKHPMAALLAIPVNRNFRDKTLGSAQFPLVQWVWVIELPTKHLAKSKSDTGVQ